MEAFLPSTLGPLGTLGKKLLLSQLSAILDSRGTVTENHRTDIFPVPEQYCGGIEPPR
jgi:hypothetical protein